MHLQQTKVGSRRSGGPQYYFHDATEPVKEFLRRRGACPVVLVTPYGIAKSPFMAVGRDHKLSADRTPMPGRVGHDRIQQGAGEQSIGEAIRYWYGLREGRDFSRIDVEVSIHDRGHFVLTPVAVAMEKSKRVQELEKRTAPLSFHRRHRSSFWISQIAAKRRAVPGDVDRATEEIARVVADHRAPAARNILEADLLRTAGALSLLGVRLSPYLGKGYDCVDSRIQFLDLPEYPCPVEIKKRSKGFTYQVARFTELPRAVVLCMEHDYVNPPEHVDVIELSTLADYLSHS